VRRAHHHRLRLSAAAAAALAAALALAGGCGDGGGHEGYSPEQRASFVAACTPGASAAVCGCFYDRLEATVSYERFLAVDRQIRRDPTDIPDDVAELAIGCAAEHAS
jgi:hypothetical protein